jgi:hypothetical protein
MYTAEMRMFLTGRWVNGERFTEGEVYLKISRHSLPG